MALKLYIAVLDEMPDFMVPTLVAHAVLAAHLQFVQDADAESYKNWLEHSFRKVVVKVNQKEFDKIAQLKCYLGQYRLFHGIEMFRYILKILDFGYQV